MNFFTAKSLAKTSEASLPPPPPARLPVSVGRDATRWMPRVASALSTRGVCARAAVAGARARGGIGRMRGAGSSWRQRGLTRCRTSVASSSSSSSSSRATDDDDAELRYVYVGNFDYFDAVEDVRAFILDALRGVVADDAGAGADDDASSSLASRAISVAVPGWTEKTLADGTVKPRKRRDEGKLHRGFAVVEFATAGEGVRAARALDGVAMRGRVLRSSAGARVKEFLAGEGEDDEEEDEEAKAARRERRAHNRRQRRRRKDRDAAALEGTLADLLRSHP
eukprot:30849-Pelagococcus_subviridis.AAC.1